MSKILVISPDEIKPEMAGPAIRALEISRHLEKEHKVTLVYRPADLPRLISEHDIIICQQLALIHYPVLRKCNKNLVFDLYNLSVFECLEIAVKEPPHYQAVFGEYRPLLNVYSEILKTGDFFICANEKQRDFWLGMLMALGRIDIRLYKDEQNFKNIIDIVPFGIAQEEPGHRRNVLKGVYPGIENKDKVIIWGGGVYDWLDPLTAIRAVHKIAANRPQVKLFFMGVKNPYRPLPKMRLASEAIELAQELGVYNKNVFFNDWVAYADRQNYLLEADIGITTYHNNLEAYYSCRTRILDYIWADLPVIISAGDGFSEIVKRDQLGLVVKDNDVDAVAQGILRLLDDTEFYNNCKKNIKDIAAGFYWDKAIVPLNHYCRSPGTAFDRSRSISGNKGLCFYISQMPFYISYFGYKGILVKIIRRIFNKIKRVISNCFIVLRKTCILVFSFSILAITFIAMILNDFIAVHIGQRNRIPR